MSEHDLVGMVLDNKYKLEQKIGEGGMGAVYQGVQIMVERPVAVKVLHASLASHEKLMQRFEVEAKAIGRMNHPNCVTLYDFGFSKQLGAFYMVMEYLEGTPMQDLLGQGLGAQEIIDISRQIALALDHAHHHHILHRDLKPENVMVTTMTDGSVLVKVLDFGIARIFQAGDDAPTGEATARNRLTQAGEIFGTPAYISPEQARGEHELTFASDLYSLGIMLYELIQGDLPFWGETPIDTIMQHINKPVPPIDRLDIPQALKQVTYDLMAKRAPSRPQTGKEVADRLGEIDPHLTSSLVATASAPFHSEVPLVPSLGEIARDHDTAISEWNSMAKTQVDLPAITQSNSGIYSKEALRDFGAQGTHDTDLGIGSTRAPRKALVIGVLGIMLLGLGVLVALAFGNSGSDASETKASTGAMTQKTAAPALPEVKDHDSPQEPENTVLLKERPDEPSKKTPLEPVMPKEELPQVVKPARLDAPETPAPTRPQKKRPPPKKAPKKKAVKKAPTKTFESISL